MGSDDEAQSCVICLATLCGEEQKRSLLCGHTFHEDCLNAYMNTKNYVISTVICLVCKMSANSFPPDGGVDAAIEKTMANAATAASTQMETPAAVTDEVAARHVEKVPNSSYVLLFFQETCSIRNHSPERRLER